MPHSKTPGGQAPSDQFQKKEAEGLGADNAPGHTDGTAPGEAPVAGDSYLARSIPSTNQPGEKGDVGA